MDKTMFSIRDLMVTICVTLCVGFMYGWTAGTPTPDKVEQMTANIELAEEQISEICSDRLTESQRHATELQSQFDQSIQQTIEAQGLVRQCIDNYEKSTELLGRCLDGLEKEIALESGIKYEI